MDLSIVIVNFNTKKLLLDCIKSVIRATLGIKYEFIVVDNASSDGSLTTISKIKSLASIKIVKNNKNLGFGKANNQGIKKSLGRYILLLNSDTKVDKNVLGEMVAWMDKNPKIGVASCALRNKDGSMHGTGGYFPTLFRVFAWMFFLEDIPLVDKFMKPFHPVHSQSPFYKGLGRFDHEMQMDWVTGAFLLIRKKAIKKAGYFDEDYFMYTEEVDLCFRIKKAGWNVYYNPSWSITHLGGASSTSEFPILSEYKGIKLFFKKHMPRSQYPLIRVFLKIGALLRIFLLGIFKGKEAVKIYAKALKLA